MLNHKRIAEAFQKYPMCAHSLSELVDTGDVTVETHAVCAVGALLVNCGAETTQSLLDADTENMLTKHHRTLKKEYGFKTIKEIKEYITVNDCGIDSAGNYYDGDRDAPYGERVRKRLLGFLHTKLPPK